MEVVIVSDNDFMEVDSEREPAPALDKVRVVNDDAAEDNDRQITIEGPIEIILSCHSSIGSGRSIINTRLHGR